MSFEEQSSESVYQDDVFGYRTEDLNTLLNERLFPSQALPEGQPSFEQTGYEDPINVADFQFFDAPEVEVKQESPTEKREKREQQNQHKRNRASGEILEYLIAEFAKNPSPTSVARKSISQTTGMSEHSVRIWFQNRRAKTKKLEKLNGTSGGSSTGNGSAITKPREKPVKPTPVHHSSFSGAGSARYSEPVLTRGTSLSGIQDFVGKAPMEINEKYSYVECSSLSVGTWQRVRAGELNAAILSHLHNLSPRVLNNLMMTTDLLVILSRKDNELNYFFSGIFQKEKVLFRIYYPLGTIVSCVLLNNQKPKLRDDDMTHVDSQLRLELNQPPRFAVHFFKDPTSAVENPNQWSICEDFSEGQQVVSAHVGEGGKKIPHMLTGSLEYLQYLNSAILAFHEYTALKAQPSFPPPPAAIMDNDSNSSPLNQVATTSAFIGTTGTTSAFDTPTNFPIIENLGDFGTELKQDQLDFSFDPADDGLQIGAQANAVPDLDLSISPDDPLYDFNANTRNYIS